MCKFYELWSLFLYRFEIYIIYDLYIYEQQSFLYQKKKVFSRLYKNSWGLDLL